MSRFSLYEQKITLKTLIPTFLPIKFIARKSYGDDILAYFS
mgnify:CR=1 FL=1